MYSWKGTAEASFLRLNNSVAIVYACVPSSAYYCRDDRVARFASESTEVLAKRSAPRASEGVRAGVLGALLLRPADLPGRRWQLGFSRESALAARQR